MRINSMSRVIPALLTNTSIRPSRVIAPSITAPAPSPVAISA
jgi:hypothetical protein